MTHAASASPAAIALRMELDRSKLPLGGEALARLTISVPHQQMAAAAARRGLALAVSLDCSGSMSEAAGSPDGSPMQFSIPRLGIRSVQGGESTKLARCKAAILEAVELLGDDDMASLSAFSSMARTLFPMSPMTKANKAKFKAALDKIEASGGTALHAGWTEAGREAAKGLDRKLLCRVALFTDGEATDGERNAEELAKQSAGLAAMGVSTSCFGVGARFNEDLMCAMADSGEGNFRYIPDAMLAAAAAVDEVNGLGATAGRKAKLRFLAEDGAASATVLNDLANDAGWLRLPTLLAGRPIEIVAKLSLSDSAALATARAELEWENRDGIVQNATCSASAPLIAADEAMALAQDPEVAGAAAALLAAKAKLDMTAALSKGDMAGAGACLESARAFLSANASYSGIGMEMASLNALQSSFASGDMHSTRKLASFQNYTRSKNQTVASGAPEPAPAEADAKQP